ALTPQSSDALRDGSSCRRGDLSRLLIALDYGGVVRRHERVELGEFTRFRAIPRAMNFGEHGVGRSGNYAALRKASQCCARSHLARITRSIHDGVDFVSCRLGIE